jgi:hypothetical protein
MTRPTPIFQPTPKQPGDLELINAHRPAHRVGGDK